MLLYPEASSLIHTVTIHYVEKQVSAPQKHNTKYE